MALGIFKALFSVEGNAGQVLKNVEIGSKALTRSVLQLSPALRNMSQSLMRSANVSDRIQPRIGRLLISFQQMALSGKVTQAQLQSFANQMAVVAEFAFPKLQVELRKTSQDLSLMTAQMREAEQSFKRAGSEQGGFQMMRDVSAGTQDSMRKLSAGSQGLMIALAATEKNVMGLAFSLIFLQFTGFLKLSLIIAGVSAALILGMKKFKDFLAEGKRVKVISDVLAIIGEGADASNLAMEDAAEVADKWGVKASDLENAMKTMAVHGVGFTIDRMELFASMLRLLEKQLLPDIDGVESLTSRFVSLAKESGATDDTIKRGLIPSTRNLARELEALLEIDAVTNLVQDFTKEVSWAGDSMQRASGGFTGLTRETLRGIDSFDEFIMVMANIQPSSTSAFETLAKFQIEAATLKNKYKDMSQGVVQSSEDATSGISDFSHINQSVIVTLADFFQLNAPVVSVVPDPNTPTVYAEELRRYGEFITAMNLIAARAEFMHTPGRIGYNLSSGAMSFQSFQGGLGIISEPTGFQRLAGAVGGGGIGGFTTPSSARFSSSRTSNTVTVVGTQATTANIGSGGLFLHHGGYVPGSPGQAVPITAHAGELVLNKRQQQGLGGITVIVQGNNFYGSPESAGNTIASRILSGIRRNGSISSAPLVTLQS